MKNAQDSPDQRIVTVSQVVTLPKLLERSQILETSLVSGNLADFCDEKVSIRLLVRGPGRIGG